MSPSIYRPDLLRGQVALVTGGGTGIGKGIATSLARAGADLVIASRKVERLEETARELAQFGTRIVPLPTNVRDPEVLRTTVDTIVNQLGRLDILVNNAAGNFYAPSATLSANAWKAVVETDL